MFWAGSSCRTGGRVTDTHLVHEYYEFMTRNVSSTDNNSFRKRPLFNTRKNASIFETLLIHALMCQELDFVSFL